MRNRAKSTSALANSVKDGASNPRILSRREPPIYFTYPVETRLEPGPRLWPALLRHIRGSRHLLRLLVKFQVTYRPSLVRSSYCVNERIVEIPFVLRNIEEQDSEILDIGCCYSPLPLELAHLGFHVWGVDQRRCLVSHPNFRFVQGDVCNLCFPSNFFDVVISLSTLEHIGIGHYGDVQRERGDLIAVEELVRALKPGGKFILTAPFGRDRITWQRIYGPAALRNVLAGFSIESVSYRVKREETWLEVDERQAAEVDSPVETRAVVLVVARKSPHGGLSLESR